MEFSSYYGGENGKHNGLDCAEIPEIFAKQDALFFGTDLFDRVHIG